MSNQFPEGFVPHKGMTDLCHAIVRVFEEEIQNTPDPTVRRNARLREVGALIGGMVAAGELGMAAKQSDPLFKAQQDSLEILRTGGIQCQLVDKSGAWRIAVGRLKASPISSFHAGYPVHTYRLEGEEQPLFPATT